MNTIDNSSQKRERGLAKMNQVYGFNVQPEHVTGKYMEMTVDHLFGEIWTDETIGIRDRRLITIGVLGALGHFDLLGVQIKAGLVRGEFDQDFVRAMCVHLAHYAGWPRSTGINQAFETALAEHASLFKDDATGQQS